MSIFRKIASLLSRKLSLGEAVPAGFGVAWQSPMTHQLVVMPIGVNVVARSLRRTWLWIRYGGAAPLCAAPEYHAGYLAGRRQMLGAIEERVYELVDAATKHKRITGHVIEVQAKRLDAEGLARFEDPEGSLSHFGGMDLEAEHHHRKLQLETIVGRLRAQLSAMRSSLN